MFKRVAFSPDVRYDEAVREAIQSAAGLRRELSARNLARAETVAHEATYGAVPSVVYAEDEAGGHGNFLAASYKRICADPQWRLRLEKSYTANARVPRATDRRRKELECCASSDALLMNIFCYPRVMVRPEVCALLGVEAGLRPEFGVRAMLPMRRGEVDRTELDMRVGELLFEAKLTETGFQTASMERVMRYEGVVAEGFLMLLPSCRGRETVWPDISWCGESWRRRPSGGRFVLLCVMGGERTCRRCGSLGDAGGGEFLICGAGWRVLSWQEWWRRFCRRCCGGFWRHEVWDRSSEVS